MRTTLGIIGVGHLAEFLVRGLRHGGAELDVILSPRNEQRSRTLASAFAATRASDNAEVVRRSELVILATRPAQVLRAAAGLPWRRGQTVVSVAAGLALEPLAAAVRPAEVTLAMPISCAAIGESPTLLYPGAAAAKALFAGLGSVHVLSDATSFRAASVIGAYYGWVHAIMRDTADWMSRQGVPDTMARELAARSLRGAADMVLAHPDSDLNDMLTSLATPGGITQSGLKVLENGDVLGHWARAGEAAQARMREIAGPDDA